MTRLWRLTALILLLCSAQALVAAPRLALLGGSESYRERFTEALRGEMAELGAADAAFAEPRRSDLLLALGDEAFLDALRLRRPVLGLFVSREVALEAFTAGCACSAFFSESDPVRQLRLARMLFPGTHRIGLITSPDSSWVAGLLAPYAERESLTLVHTDVPDGNALARELPRLLAQTDLLLAVSDPQLYTAGTARLVLLTSYRQNKPVIGPDELFVQAGSVATTYSSGEDMVRQAARAILDFHQRGRLPPPDFPRVFSVLLNRHVARSYGVPVMEEPSLQQQLEAER